MFNMVSVDNYRWRGVGNNGLGMFSRSLPPSRSLSINNLALFGGLEGLKNRYREYIDVLHTQTCAVKIHKELNSVFHAPYDGVKHPFPPPSTLQTQNIAFRDEVSL